MTYGAYTRTAAQYRDVEVLAATPGQLVVHIFDHALAHLTRVRALPGATDVDARSTALQRARAALSELLLHLDHERGGPIATHLAAIYSFLLGELSTLGVRFEARKTERIIQMVTQLREAFAQAATAAASGTAA